MKTFRNTMLAIAALAGAGFFTSTAYAQTKVAEGHFTLPFEAEWAGRVMPAGNYTLSVVRLTGSRNLAHTVTLAVAGKEVTILGLKPLGPDVVRESMLVSVNNGGRHSIRALKLACANLVLTFPATKAKRTLIAEAPERIQSVPILVAAK